MIVKPEVSVIGGGPAGLAAAIAARKAGAEKVVVFERAEVLGGVLHQCIHNGFGLHYFKDDLTGPEYAHRLIEEAAALGVEFLTDTMVLDIGRDRTVTAVNKRGVVEAESGAVILSMGCRERTAGAIGLPGLRPAGVYTAGVAQRLVNIEGYLPGREVVILGSGDIGMIMARRLTLEGAKVKAVYELLPYPSGLVRNEVQCLQDYGIPLHLSHTVSFIHGKDRVEGVTVSQVDQSFHPIEGTARDIPCDTLLLSVGLIPENELSRMAGIDLDPVTTGAIVSQTRETSVPGVFACGNVLHVHDLADNASLEAEVAGASAARYARGGLPGARSHLATRAGANVRYVVPQKIDPAVAEEKTTFWLRVTKPMDDLILKGGSKKRKVPFARPSEMLSFTLTKQDIAGLAERGEDLVVDCEPA
jgi:NADPH-dependent 2,4-dienoyl-CoA reductase/sulfur reductase-like enzyme